MITGDYLFQEDEIISLRAQVAALTKEPEMKTTKRLKEQDGWIPLSDVQWVNIVNHRNVWHEYSKDEAVHEVQKMTEAKCKENNSATIKELCELVEEVEKVLEGTWDEWGFVSNRYKQTMQELFSRVAKFQKGE